MTTPPTTRLGNHHLAAVIGGVGMALPALILADPPPALLPAALAGTCWWLSTQVVLATLAVAWGTAGDREIGRTQHLFLAGAGSGGQIVQRCRAALAASYRAVPAAAIGGALVAAGTRARDGSWDVLGRGSPGAPLVLAAVVGPILGVALGSVAGLAAPTRRHLGVAMLAAVTITVSVFLLRPFTPAAAHGAVATPLGGAWPVTPGWSLDRYLALATSPARRAASFVGWWGLVTVLAARQVRQGAARRSAPPTDAA